MRTLSTYSLGLLSEYIAAAFLTFKGYKILKLRYRNVMGEIDLIARKGSAFIFVEIKTVKQSSEFPAVGPKQIARIKRCAELYLVQKNIYEQATARFDLITISWPFRIKHYRNVF